MHKTKKLLNSYKARGLFFKNLANPLTLTRPFLSTTRFFIRTNFIRASRLKFDQELRTSTKQSS